jgi:hypothetical protein
MVYLLFRRKEDIMAIGDVVERYQVTVEEDGSMFGYEHTFPCPVCRKRYAILNGSDGVFEPCWDCQTKGWHLVKMEYRRWWWQRWSMALRLARDAMSRMVSASRNRLMYDLAPRFGERPSQQP